MYKVRKKYFCVIFRTISSYFRFSAVVSTLPNSTDNQEFTVNEFNDNNDIKIK